MAIPHSAVVGLQSAIVVFPDHTHLLFPHIPEHVPVHTAVCVSAPTQSVLYGSGLPQVRLLVDVPAPQSFEQLSHVDHSDQPKINTAPKRECISRL